MKIRYLQKLWGQFNAKYFDGKLEPITLRISRSESYWGKFVYTESSLSRKILLSGHKNETPADWEDSLLHEMIHQYLMQIGVEEPDDHGPRFLQEALRVNLDLSKGCE